MLTRMKTTVDISDALLDAAKRIAARDRTTVQALIEQGLRQVLDKRKQIPGFRLRKASFRGNGLQPDVRGASWDRMRELAYGGRGS